MGEKIDTKLRSEVLNLFQYIQRLREKLAAMSLSRDDGTAIESMGVQLGAIVANTEHATDSILKSVEAINDATAALHKEKDPEKFRAHIDDISQRATEITEACAFQDIAGQRVSKIVGSLKFVEDHINMLVDLWGREEIKALSAKLVAPDLDADEPRLEGPALPGKAISQEEIDALFD